MFTRKHAWLFLAVLSASLLAPLCFTARHADVGVTMRADGTQPPAPPILPWLQQDSSVTG